MLADANFRHSFSQLFSAIASEGWKNEIKALQGRMRHGRVFNIF